MPSTCPASAAGLARSPGLPLAPTAAAASSLADTWDKAAALANQPGHMSDEDLDLCLALERDVLCGTITCRADALAKLRAVAISFERGELADGSDADALADAIAWLEAH